MKPNIKIASQSDLTRLIAESVRSQDPIVVPMFTQVVLVPNVTKAAEIEVPFVRNRKTEFMTFDVLPGYIWFLDEDAYRRVSEALREKDIEFTFRRIHLPEGNLDLDTKGNIIDENHLRLLRHQVEDPTRKPEDKFKGEEIYQLLNTGCSFMPESAGFFRPKLDLSNIENAHNYPFPVITTAQGYKRMDFVRKVKEREAVVNYKVSRGMTADPWTGKGKTTAHYEDGRWIWKSDYTDYLEQGVLPSRAFYLHIMGVDLETLPKENGE